MAYAACFTRSELYCQRVMSNEQGLFAQAFVDAEHRVPSRLLDCLHDQWVRVIQLDDHSIEDET